jgi:hypothetical protein
VGIFSDVCLDLPHAIGNLANYFTQTLGIAECVIKRQVRTKMRFGCRRSKYGGDGYSFDLK